MLAPMSKPLVASSMVIGETPVTEQSLDAARLGAGLQGGEETAVEALVIGEGLVRLLAMLRQYGVGNVVVLVDQHIDMEPSGAGQR